MSTQSEYLDLFKARFGKNTNSGDKDTTYEEKADYLWLLNAPQGFGVEKEMFDFMRKNPNTTMKEMLHYYDEIAPRGLAYDDDGEDLLTIDDD